MKSPLPYGCIESDGFPEDGNLTSLTATDLEFPPSYHTGIKACPCICACGFFAW